MTHYQGSLPDTARAVDWRELAACRREHTDLFFPVGSSPAAQAQTRDAQRVCRRCPVVEACWAWALETHEEYGVWGGMPEHARRRLLRRRGHHTPDGDI